MTKLTDLASKIIMDSISLKESILSDTLLLARIDNACNYLIDAYQNNQTVYFCGNGGSAADSQHLAAELTGRFNYDRPPLAAEALHVNPSYMTAVSNDYDFTFTYSRLIDGIGKKGDILFALSTSGNSENIVKAVESACSKGLKTISLTGQTGGVLKSISDITINIPSSCTPRIQEAHMIIGHILCEYVEATLFPQ